MTGPGSRHTAHAVAALWLLLLLCLLPALALGAVNVSAVRAWPSPEYTRIAIEAPEPIEFAIATRADSSQIVLDLANAPPNPVLLSLPGRIAEKDPLIAHVQVSAYQNGSRVVIALREPVRPEAFPLRPTGDYAYRLVLDVYPLTPPDPLMALLEGLQDEEEETGGQGAASPAPTPASKPAPKTVPKTAPEAAQTAVPTAPAAGSRTRMRPTQPAQTSLPRVIRLTTVAIDAGHGGEDPGAKGSNGTFEKDVTLAIAKRLKQAVDARPNMRGVLIRAGDYSLKLQDRVDKARRLRADLFVSIHADAFIRPEARGSSVFALSQRGATSAAARWLARKENDADLISGVNLDVPDLDVKRTMIELQQDSTIRYSIKLGQAVLAEMGDINVLHKPRVEQAGFAVLKAPDIPSILVETAFISNPVEERKLRSPEHQAKVARAILSGILKYFAEHPPAGADRMALR